MSENQSKRTQDSDKVNTLVGLLDFYSDRATTHASFVIASVFGIYAILLSHNWLLPLLCWIGAYVALQIIALYSFENFRYYAVFAGEIRRKLEEGEDQYSTKIKNELKKDHSFDLFIKLKESTMLKYCLLGILWVLATVLPFLWIAFHFLA